MGGRGGGGGGEGKSREVDKFHEKKLQEWTGGVTVLGREEEIKLIGALMLGWRLEGL